MREKSLEKPKRQHRRTGRPRGNGHVPTDALRGQVERMAGLGASCAHIATVLNLSDKTVAKHYGRELSVGAVKANLAVSNSLFRRATRGGRQDVSAMMWWDKTRGGYHDVSRHEVTGPRGGPIQSAHTISLADLTDEQLAVLEQIAGSLTAPVGNPGGEDEA